MRPLEAAALIILALAAGPSDGNAAFFDRMTLKGTVDGWTHEEVSILAQGKLIYLPRRLLKGQKLEQDRAVEVYMTRRDSASIRVMRQREAVKPRK